MYVWKMMKRREEDNKSRIADASRAMLSHFSIAQIDDLVQEFQCIGGIGLDVFRT